MLHISAVLPHIYPPPPPLNTFILHLGESDHSKVDVSHMPDSRKRLHSEQRLPEESSQLPSKKQRLNHPRGSQPPAEFWDNLSKIWLTERALKELDRRIAQPAPSSHRSQYRRSRGPVTRSAVAKWKNKEEYWESLRHYSAEPSRDIELLARHGGLDLSDLRGVRVARFLRKSTLIIPLVPETCQSPLSHHELEPVQFQRRETEFDKFFEYQTYHKYHNH